MSNRRKIGEVVVKKEHAGFTSQRLIIRIPSLETFKSAGFPYDSLQEDQEQCPLSCGDPECIEYANVEVLDNKLNQVEWCYHVSECQMEDLPKGVSHDDSKSE